MDGSATSSILDASPTSTNMQQQDSAQTAFNKLARTFAAQVEALKRY